MPRKPGRLLFVFVPLLAAALTLGVRYAWENWVRSAPVFVYPKWIDLGNRDQGETITARFVVGNSGTAELVIDQFATTCTCAAVERQVGDSSVPVKSVRLPPGESTALIARIGVAAPMGDSQLVHVYCRTNDPACPAAEVSLFIPVVTGGISAYPRSVVFGNLPLSQQATRLVELYDLSSRGSRVTRVRSVPPERFEVRLLPLKEAEADRTDGPKLKLVSRIEVTARSERPRALDGDIEVYLGNDERPHTRIAVTGEVVSSVTSSPSLVVLPRRSGNQTIYSSEIVIQSREGAPVAIRVLSAPTGLRTEVRPMAGQADRRLIFVEAESGSSPPKAELRILLGVRCGDHKEETVEIPVRIAELPS